MNLNKLLKRLLLFLAVMLCNISIQAQYITKALDENDESTFKWENASNFILFDVGEAEREAMEGKILADYNIDDVTRHLYIWDGTYVGGDGSGMNSFGQLEDHIALTVANVGWSGFSMIKDGGIDLSMLDDTYVLHFAMKAKPTDFTSHGFGFAQAKFTIGPNAFVDGSRVHKLLGDIGHDNEWYYVDIPFSVLRQCADNGIVFPEDKGGAAAYNDNHFWCLSGGVAGSELHLDNIFIYKDATIEYEIIGDLCYWIDLETKTAMVVHDDSYYALTDVVIPATIEVDGETYTVTGVESGAFSGCNLRSVSIYANLTEGTGGFRNCTVGTLYVADNVATMLGLGINPSSIYCFGNTPPVCDDNTFSTYNAALHVSEQAMIDYFMADVWCNFNNINSDAGEQPKSLSLSQDSASIKLGETLQLTATALPSSVVAIHWQSTNAGVATVTDNGLVTAVAAGEADIIVTCMGLRKQCHVMVEEEAIVATIDPQELTLERGNDATLTVTTSPIEANVTWRSTNSDVATVTVSNGRATVLAVAPGEALIIATPEGSNVVPDTCHVTVNELMVVVSIDRHELRMKRNDIVYLTATTSPLESTVTWSSTNTNVALVRVVNGRAMVVANRPGEAMIIATTAGELVQSDTCHVTVKRPRGDVNNDGLVDVTDVNEVVNIILGKAEGYEINSYIDTNDDNKIDVTDVNNIVNIILGKIFVEFGIREGSATQLFEVELKSLYEELDANAIHPTVAAMGDYVVVCLGDGRTPVYVNKATGEKVGEIALG